MKTVLYRRTSRNRFQRKNRKLKRKNCQRPTHISACSVNKYQSGRTMVIKLLSALSVDFRAPIPSRDARSAMNSITCILASSTKDVLSVPPGTGQRVFPTLCSLLAFSVRILFRRGTYIKTKAKCAVQTATLSDQS